MGGVLTLGLFVLALALPTSVHAVKTLGAIQTTVTPAAAGSTGAVYSSGRYRTDNKELVTGCQITFPVGTIVSGATAIDPPGTVTVTGQTVRIVFSNPVIPDRTTFNVDIGGITNPPAGTYNAGNMTFWTTDLNGVPTGTTALPTGDYTITGNYLSVSITTPHAGQSVDFGAVNPGVVTAPLQVTVQVTSTLAYTITRAISGDTAKMGLVVTGTATGAKPIGTNVSWVDDYTLNPPWTTDPSVPLTATVLYTVAQ
ncbi:MAG: hypothetical protein Q8K99_06490 [Actinomycetota bacterium]|nr:hypothetical protein [Actinomycetota bacterium]